MKTLLYMYRSQNVALIYAATSRLLCAHWFETEFGFKIDKTPEAIRFNAELASTLLGNCKLFTCKVTIHICSLCAVV